MHRTDPSYVAIVVIFTLVILTILLRRLRASLPGERGSQSDAEGRPTNAHIQAATSEDSKRDAYQNDD